MLGKLITDHSLIEEKANEVAALFGAMLSSKSINILKEYADKRNNSKSYNEKMLKAAKVRFIRYSKRVHNYDNRQEHIRKHLNVFTPSYDALTYEKLEESKMRLYMSMEDIKTHEGHLNNINKYKDDMYKSLRKKK